MEPVNGYQPTLIRVDAMYIYIYLYLYNTHGYILYIYNGGVYIYIYNGGVYIYIHTIYIYNIYIYMQYIIVNNPWFMPPSTTVLILAGTGRCDAGYSGPSCEAFCPNACSGTLGQKGGEMVVSTRENVAFDETNQGELPEKMMENVGLMENEGLDQTNRGNDRNSPTHTGVNQPKIGV